MEAHTEDKTRLASRARAVKVAKVMAIYFLLAGGFGWYLLLFSNYGHTDSGSWYSLHNVREGIHELNSSMLINPAITLLLGLYVAKTVDVRFFRIFWSIFSLFVVIDFVLFRILGHLSSKTDIILGAVEATLAFVVSIIYLYLEMKGNGRLREPTQ